MQINEAPPPSTPLPLEISLSRTPPLFHPHLTIRLQNASSGITDIDSCKTHIRLHLPDEVFVDPDELIDLYALAGVEWNVNPQVVDIERPVRLHHPSSDEGNTGIELLLAIPTGLEVIDVPLHVRYLAPSALGSREVVVIGTGSVLAGAQCGADSANLALIPLALEPIAMTLPTGKPSHQVPVELTTAAVIWLGWFYLAWKIYRFVQRETIHDHSKKIKTS